MTKINTDISIKKARELGYLTTFDLSELTGVDRLFITTRARRIPGALKLTNGRWIFPEKSVQWVLQRAKIKFKI
jgi:hypothetical protein